MVLCRRRKKSNAKGNSDLITNDYVHDNVIKISSNESDKLRWDAKCPHGVNVSFFLMQETFSTNGNAGKRTTKTPAKTYT